MPRTNISVPDEVKEQMDKRKAKRQPYGGYIEQLMEEVEE